MGWTEAFGKWALFVGLRNTKVGPSDQIGLVGHTCVTRLHDLGDLNNVVEGDVASVLDLLDCGNLLRIIKGLGDEGSGGRHQLHFLRDLSGCGWKENLTIKTKKTSIDNKNKSKLH